MAWRDANGDGARTARELGLIGITIRLFKPGAQVGQTVTGSDGSYRFPPLLPGSYTVREVQPDWLRWSTTANVVTVDLLAGQQVEVNFGDWSGLPVWLPLLLR